jgi:copper transport protein
VRRALVLVAALAVVLPGNGWAHATLTRTAPSFRAELRRGPAEIRLHFDQNVTILANAVHVLDAAGREHAERSRVDGTTVVTPLRPLRRGAYTVRWQAVSADGHVVSGVWTFGVRVAAPPPTGAYGATGPTRTEHAVRWLYFLGLALLIGALGLRLIVLRGLAVPARVEGRLLAAAGIGGAVVVQTGIAAFCLRAEDALRLPFGRFLYGDLSPMAQTRFGQAFVVSTLGFALVLALVALAWVADRPALLAPAFVLAVAFASALSLSGHDAVDAGSSWKTELADWVHLSAASLWVGGLGVLIAVVWPAAPELRRVAFLRFSRLATGLVGLVLCAGVYLSVVRLPHVSDLWTQGYGHVLLVKLALVAVALAWGGFHHAIVRPRLERASDGFVARVGRSLAGESLVGVAVLLAAAVLVDSKPPPRPATAPPVQAAQR